MRIIIGFGLIVLMLSCQSRQQNSENEIMANVDSALPDTTIERKTIEKEKSNPVGYIYTSDIVRFMGDTTIDTSKMYYPEIKFEPYIYFDDFLVDSIYTGQKSPIDYASNSTAKRFKTVLTDSYSRSSINFAGYYSLIWWGCGSSCQQTALVDWRDGNVYDGPDASHGFDFMENSRMMIINPPDSAGFYVDCIFGHPQIWIWNEATKSFHERKPNN